jgi:hypothetical protein
VLPTGWACLGLVQHLASAIIQATPLDAATHAGHLGAVRELIDGKAWMVLT